MSQTWTCHSDNFISCRWEKLNLEFKKRAETGNTCILQSPCNSKRLQTKWSTLHPTRLILYLNFQIKLKLCWTLHKSESRQVQGSHGADSEGGINTVLTVQVEVPMSFVTSQRGDFQKCASCMPISKEKQVLKKKKKSKRGANFCGFLRQGRVRHCYTKVKWIYGTMKLNICKIHSYLRI